MADTLSDKEVVTFRNLGSDLTIQCIESISTGSRITYRYQVKLAVLNFHYSVSLTFTMFSRRCVRSRRSNQNDPGCFGSHRPVGGGTWSHGMVQDARFSDRGRRLCDTPDALEKALNTCRSHCLGDLVCFWLRGRKRFG